jgi:hypothetical protein
MTDAEPLIAEEEAHVRRIAGDLSFATRTGDIDYLAHRVPDLLVTLDEERRKREESEAELADASLRADYCYVQWKAAQRDRDAAHRGHAECSAVLNRQDRDLATLREALENIARYPTPIGHGLPCPGAHVVLANAALAAIAATDKPYPK